MRASRFNILSKLPDSRHWIVVNLLSGQADWLNEQEASLLEGEQNQWPAEFIEKGYVADPDEEAVRYRLAYLDFLEKRDKEEVQLFFVPTYECNFSCAYCYQSAYPAKPGALRPEVIEGFFRFAGQYLEARRSYVTLFGGEPLLTGSSYSRSLLSFMESCSASGRDLAIVTNGYTLDQWLPELSQHSIREIQITLDGPTAVHDKRRARKGGLPSFDQIARNLDLCLEAGFMVNLRVVLDRDNLSSLPALARLARERGWTDSPLFKTQLGRNYELHSCQSGRGKLFSRLELYTELYQMIRQQPDLLTFHKPSFSVASFLADNGSLPDALFDACPGTKSEWALDFRGDVYACTATVGKPGEKLGQFVPHISLNEEEVSKWQSRDVLAITQCRDCSLQLACGGGCGSLARNRQGDLLQPDCRPVAELIGLGISLYNPL